MVVVIEVEFVVEKVGFLLEIHGMIAVAFDFDVQEVGSVVVELEFVVGEVEFILAEVEFVIEIHRMRLLLWKLNLLNT